MINKKPVISDNKMCWIVLNFQILLTILKESLNSGLTPEDNIKNEV